MEPDIKRAIETANWIKNLSIQDKYNATIRVENGVENLVDAFFKIHLFYQRGQFVIEDLKKCVTVMECPLADFEEEDGE
jgi:hypothetical protein